MSRFSRRRFLWLLVGGGLLLGAGTAAWSRWRGNPASIVQAILQRRLGPLVADEKTAAAFARDYLAFREDFRRTLTQLAFLAGPLRLGSPYSWLPMGHPLRRLEDNVVSQFLLSTDFFENTDDGARVPRYVGFHDPALRPCRNPFATRPDPPGIRRDPENDLALRVPNRR